MKPPPSPRLRAALVLAAGVLCIAWTAIFVRWAGVPGPTAAFYRLAIAAALLAPARALARPAQKPSRLGILSAVIAGLFFACDLGFYNTAILTTSAASATLIGNNAPLLVALGAWALWRQRPAPSFWPGFVLGTIGLVAIVGGDFLEHPHLGRGDALAVVSATCYAGYLLSVQRGGRGCDPLTFNAISTGVGAAALLVACLLLDLPLGGWSAKSWAALGALGLITQVGGYLCVTWAVGRLSATTASVSLLAQAPVTALLAVPLLGEAIAPSQLVGGTLVLAGVWVVNRGAAPAPAATEPAT